MEFVALGRKTDRDRALGLSDSRTWTEAVSGSVDLMKLDADKETLRALLLEQLRRDHAAALRQAGDAADAATHEENRAEGSKDMRATEASYLARGQAERAQQLAAELARIAAWPLRGFTPGEPIEASALVELEGPGAKRSLVWLVPAAAGRRLVLDGYEVQTLSLESPLGSVLRGSSQDDEVEVEGPKGARVYAIRAVR